jgi:hypothetical protein
MLKPSTPPSNTAWGRTPFASFGMPWPAGRSGHPGAMEGPARVPRLQRLRRQVALARVMAPPNPGAAGDGLCRV